MSMVGNILAMKRFNFGTGKTWAETATITTAEQTVDAPGVRVGDLVLVLKPTHQAGLDYNPIARVANDDVLTIRFSNPTAAGITATALESWIGIVIRPEKDTTATAYT